MLCAFKVREVLSPIKDGLGGHMTKTGSRLDSNSDVESSISIREADWCIYISLGVNTQLKQARFLLAETLTSKDIRPFIP